MHGLLTLTLATLSYLAVAAMMLALLTKLIAGVLPGKSRPHKLEQLQHTVGR